MATSDRGYLLDTHTFLWAAADSKRLGREARARIVDRESTLFLSVASVWEMAIKSSLGKLDLPSSVETFVGAQLTAVGAQLLDIRPVHAARVENIAFHHRDPFDRLLVAQSLVEGLSILAADTAFDAYGVERVW